MTCSFQFILCGHVQVLDHLSCPEGPDQLGIMCPELVQEYFHTFINVGGLPSSWGTGGGQVGGEEGADSGGKGFRLFSAASPSPTIPRACQVK